LSDSKAFVAILLDLTNTKRFVLCKKANLCNYLTEDRFGD